MVYKLSASLVDLASLVAQVIKASACNAGDMGSIPGLGRSPGEENGNTPAFLSGKSHGQGSLAGYSPWGHKTAGNDLVTKQQQ